MKTHGNKENFIKRVQSGKEEISINEMKFLKGNLEMVLSKHSSFDKNENPKSRARTWQQSHRLWSNILKKTLDKTYRIPRHFLDSHPTINNKMRSVLFDWLIEVKQRRINRTINLFFLFKQVCEVYHLHRETYHLAIAYIDQYLSQTKNFLKNKFQLLGITSLFIAAKIEVKDISEPFPSLLSTLQEIYPPRLTDFSYVTDGTYSEEDILNMELDLMNVRRRGMCSDHSKRWGLFFRH